MARLKIMESAFK